jgi:hypothetical protein
MRHNCSIPCSAPSFHNLSENRKGLALTLEELLDHAASECIDTRESYLVVFTVGVNGYVCPNDGATYPSRALFHGTYRECQIWIERRGISAALDYLSTNIEQAPEIAGSKLSARDLLKLITQSAK